MSLTKKYAFVLSMMILAPVQQSHTLSAPSNLKDAAKHIALLSVGITLAYYFFHYPVDRRSGASMENIFKGKWDNITGDFFNWDNVTDFTDIVPGQRHKVFPWTIKASELPNEKYLQFTTGDTTDIKGFGLYYFCEKNMNKIVKYFAATATLYALLWSNLPTKRDILEILFDTYKKVPTQV